MILANVEIDPENDGMIPEKVGRVHLGNFPRRSGDFFYPKDLYYLTNKKTAAEIDFLSISHL
jgi:hypothetical protein